jgi:hypothetical protein
MSEAILLTKICTSSASPLKTIVFLLFQISQRKARRTEIIMAMREDRNVFTLHAKKNPENERL